MKGFVASGVGTGYPQFIKLLEESVDSLYRPRVTIEKHRFGTVEATFADLADTFKPAFYDAAKGYEDTDLKVVGDHMKPMGLTIVITDLFQSDDHVETFRAALLDKGLGRTFQFGILSLSTEFNGMLYDIPPLKTSMHYQGPHPLYAIVLGPQKQVSDLINDVVHRGGANFVQAALLASDLANPEVPLHELRVLANGPSYLSLNEVDPADDNERAIVQADPAPSFTRSLRLAHVASHPTIVYQTELAFDPSEVLPVGAERVEAWKLNTFVHVCGPAQRESLWTSLKQAFPSKAKAPAEISATPQAAPRTDPCPIQNPELLTEAPKLQVKPMPQNKGIVASISVDLGTRNDSASPIKALANYIYVVDLKMVPATRDYAFPQWVMNLSQPPGKPFDGKRTPNLLGFLTNINQSIAQAIQPAALDDYLYIQSD